MTWLTNFFSRHKVHTDVSEEIRQHLEEKMEALISDGLPRQDAKAQARREFGNLTLIQRDSRDVWRWPQLDNFLLDARYALRMFRKSPAFTSIAILTLALGIGANTAIFTVVNTALLHALPFPDAPRLVDIAARSTMFDFTHLGLSLPDIADLRASSQSFATIATYQYSSSELTGGGQPARIETAEVSGELFPLLGIQPLFGRTFASLDMQPGSRAVMIGHSLWRERFSADATVIGKSLMLDGQPHTIIGVIPSLPKLDFVTDLQLWTPLLPTNDQLAARDNHAFSVLARLRPGVTIDQAQKDLDIISAHLATAYPDVDKSWSIQAAALKTSLLGDATAPLTVLFCAVGFVLLIACANVSNLFLSRGCARRREFAVRAAIGASRAAILRQLAVECLLIALAAGACAFFIALFALNGLRSILPTQIPRLQDLRVEAVVAWFTLGASLLAAFLSGLAPALLTSRQDLNLAIKDSSSTPRTSAHNLLRQFLVISEIALAFVLLVGAILALESFSKILRAGLGFHPDHLVTLKIDFPRFRFAKSGQSIAFVQHLLESTRAVPGVQAASAGIVFPLGDEVAETTFQTQDSVKDPKAGELSALSNLVAPDFFRTLAIPILAGRDFDNSDSSGKSPVFIVNETLARKFFGSADVIGKPLSTRVEAGRPIWGEIVGVAGNVRGVDPAERKPEIYAPFYQARRAAGVYLVVRANPDPLAIVPAIQDRIWSIDKNQPITSIKTVEAQIAEVHATPKSQSLLLGFFGALGFALALIGVYGVMSYLISQQTHEIGIRMALGANPRSVLRLFLVHGLKLTLIGAIIGIAAALALTRFMRNLLFAITSNDPLTFAAVATLLTSVALAACYLPARRAMRVDPLTALRHE